MNLNLAMLFAAGTGCCIALQASANNRLRQTITENGNDAQALWATYCSILGTILFSTLAMIATRPPVPAMASLRNTEWWNWIGGPLGAMVVLGGTFLVQDLGAARFVAFVVAGQLLASLLLDHFGLMGLVRESLTFGKAAGALLVVFGVICIKFL